MLGQRIESVAMNTRHGAAVDSNNETAGVHTRSSSWPQPCTRTTRSAHKRCSLPEHAATTENVAEVAEVADKQYCNNVGRRFRKSSDTDECDHKSGSTGVSHHTRMLDKRVRATSPRAKQRLDGVVECIVSQQSGRKLPFRAAQRLCYDGTIDMSSKTSPVIAHHHDCRSELPVITADMTARPADCSVVSPCSKIDVMHDAVDYDGDMCTRGSDVDTPSVSSLDHVCLTSNTKSEAMPCLQCEFDNSLAAAIEYDESTLDETKVKSPEANGTLMPVLVKENLVLETSASSRPSKYRKMCCTHSGKTKQRYSPTLHHLLSLNNNKVTNNMNHDKTGVYDFEPSLPDCKWTDVTNQKMESNKPCRTNPDVPIQKVFKEARYHSKLIVHHGSKVPRLRIRMLVDPVDSSAHAVINNCNPMRTDVSGNVSSSPKRRFSKCSRTLQSSHPSDSDFPNVAPDGVRTKGPPLKRMRLKFGSDSIDIPIPVGSNDSLGWC